MERFRLFLLFFVTMSLLSWMRLRDAFVFDALVWAAAVLVYLRLQKCTDQIHVVDWKADDVDDDFRQQPPMAA